MTPFEFAAFLDLAEELATRTEEAAWRSATSRAYYAVLHVAHRTLPPPLRATITSRDTHRLTWRFYTASSVQVCQQVGHAGLRLRDSRVDADYRPFPAISSVQALHHVTRARQAMERLQRHGYQP